MDAICPQRQIAIVGAGGDGCAPIKLNHMAGIAKDEPTRAASGLAVIILSEPNLIVAGAKPEFDIEHQFRCSRDCIVANKQVMGIALCHCDAVGGKVKPRPIARFGGGSLINHIN